MRPCLFDSFADMIGALSTATVLRTLERESVMLEQDLVQPRLSSPFEVSSILSFCWFVEAIRQGWPTFAIPATPPVHLVFYRTTLQRLVAAGELPVAAKTRFDGTFCTRRLVAPWVLARDNNLNAFDHMTYDEQFVTSTAEATNA